MPLLVSLFLGFVPMFFFAALVYWLDRYEKEPKILLGATFFWGVVIAAGGAHSASAFMHLLDQRPQLRLAQLLLLRQSWRNFSKGWQSPSCSSFSTKNLIPFWMA